MDAHDPPLAIEQLTERLDRIESTLIMLLKQQAKKDWYGTDEVAAILGRDSFTVREWARLGRIRAEKRRSGRGRYRSWAISHEELLRIEREGLLPHGP